MYVLAFGILRKFQSCVEPDTQNLGEVTMDIGFGNISSKICLPLIQSAAGLMPFDLSIADQFVGPDIPP